MVALLFLGCAALACEPAPPSPGGPAADTPRASVPAAVDISVTVPYVDDGAVTGARVTGELSCVGGDTLRVELRSDAILEAELTLRGPDGLPVKGWRGRPATLTETVWSAESWALCAGRIHRYHLVIASV